MRLVRNAAGLGLLLLVACARQETATPPPAPSPAARDTVGAVVDLSPSSGSTVQGSLMLTEEAGGVRFSGKFSGLSRGEHGIHLHQNGDCSASDASSAGGHYDLPGSQGGPDAPEHRLWDLGNLNPDTTGTAEIDYVFPGLSLKGARSILGKAVVVHASNPTTQSTAAEARVACGVIMLR